MIPANTIRDAINATPFQPFRIRTAAERSYKIAQPDWLTIGPKNLSLVIWSADDGASFIDMAEIAGIELLEPDDVESREATFSFDVILRGVVEITDALKDATLAAGFDKLFLWSRDGNVGLRFRWVAGSLGQAIGSAVEEVERAGFAVARVEVVDLVSVE